MTAYNQINIAGPKFQKILNQNFFFPSDESVGADPAYYGFVSTDGEVWYIQRYSPSAGTFRYASNAHVTGSTATYSYNWDNRTSLTYRKFFDEFGA